MIIELRIHVSSLVMIGIFIFHNFNILTLKTRRLELWRRLSMGNPFLLFLHIENHDSKFQIHIICFFLDFVIRERIVFLLSYTQILEFVLYADVFSIGIGTAARRGMILQQQLVEAERLSPSSQCFACWEGGIDRITAQPPARLTPRPSSLPYPVQYHTLYPGHIIGLPSSLPHLSEVHPSINISSNSEVETVTRIRTRRRMTEERYDHAYGIYDIILLPLLKICPRDTFFIWTP